MFKIKDSFEGYIEGTLADRRSLYFSHRLMHVRGHAPPPRTENRDCDFYSIPLLKSWDVEGLYCDFCCQEDRMWIEGTSPAPSEAWFIFQEVMACFPVVKESKTPPPSFIRPLPDQLCKSAGWPRVIAFAGPLASGKTTAARHLEEKFGYLLTPGNIYCQVWRQSRIAGERIVLDHVDEDILRRLSEPGEDSVVVWIDPRQPDRSSPIFQFADIQCLNTGTEKEFLDRVEWLLGGLEDV